MWRKALTTRMLFECHCFVASNSCLQIQKCVLGICYSENWKRSMEMALMECLYNYARDHYPKTKVFWFKSCGYVEN